MNQQKLFDYVMNTPHNTNPAILKQKIKDVSGASSWNDLKDRPFGTETIEEIILENHFFDYSQNVDGWFYLETERVFAVGDNVIVIYNGEKFDCVAIEGEDGPEVNAEKFRFIIDGELCVWLEENATITLLTISETVYKIDAKYLPDPFWMEENKTLVVEGVSDNGDYHVQSQIEVGKEYTYLIDGVEYTGIGEYERPDYQIHLYNAIGEEGCIIYDYGIRLDNRFFDVNASHKIELVERVYHTHHDFMVIVNTQEGENIYSDYKLVAGDFATAKARILKGLPVTAYVCSTFVGDGFKGCINYETLMTYWIENGEECMYSDSVNNFLINPDNTVQAD